MKPPQEMEEGVWKEIRRYEEEKNMPYITSVEKIGIQQEIEQGIQQGIQQGEIRLLCRLIARKYRLSPKVVTEYLENLDSEALLELGDRILEWNSFDQVKNWIHKQQGKG
jgi:hypothetical protein